MRYARRVNINKKNWPRSVGDEELAALVKTLARDGYKLTEAEAREAVLNVVDLLRVVLEEFSYEELVAMAKKAPPPELDEPSHSHIQ